MAYDKAHFDRVRELLAGKEAGPEVCPPPAEGFIRELELGRMIADPPEWAANRPDIIEKLARPGRVALTGGIASGKSTVAEIFRGLGADLIDFDLLARRAVEPGSPGLAAAAKLLGPEVIGPDGKLDRSRAAALVFSDLSLKAGLEAIIHPLVWEMMGRELEVLAGRRTVLVSVPLLFEAGLESFFRTIVLVFVDRETQIERLMKRQPGLDRAGAERLINSQWPAPPKVMGSTCVVDNSGSPEETARQAENVWKCIS